MPIVFIILAIIVIAAVAVISHRMEQKRRLALKTWALSRGFRFASAKNRSLARHFPDLQILHRGHSRFARYVMTGDHEGRKLWAFDYQYTTGHGKNRHTHNLSVVIIKSTHPLLPLLIRRENVFDKLGEFVGLDDIDFESAEFSRKFYVKSPDKRWAYDVIHAKMMDYLLANCRQTIHFDGQHIMVRGNRRFDEQGYAAAVDLIHGMYELFPAYLVEQMTGQKTARLPSGSTRSRS